MNKRILLLQTRKNPTSISQEQTCFFRVTGLEPAQFTVKNVLTESVSESDLNGVDALFLGGSGEYAGSDHFENEDALAAVVRAARELKLPTFGVCFGAQFLARLFGGEVVRDDEKQELGTYDITTTDVAQADPIFSSVPKIFRAQEAHNFYIKTAPPDAVVLAQSEQCPVQAFTFPGSNMYATLFHPEMSVDDMRARIAGSHGYVRSAEHMKSILASLKESRDAAGIIQKFLERT